MPSPSRRRFLGGSALTIAALTGYVEPGSRLETTRTETSAIEGELGDVLDPLPTADAVDRSYRLVLVDHADDVDGSDNVNPRVRMGARALDVDLGELSTVVSTFTENYQRRLGVVAGSFDAQASDDPADTVGDWQIEDDGNLGTASVDGLTAYAGGTDGDKRLDTARTMAKAATGDAERFVETAADADAAFDALGSAKTVLFVPDPGSVRFLTSDASAFRSIAAGFETPPSQLSGQSTNEYHLFPADDATVDDETIESVVAAVDPGEVTETSISRDEGVVRVEAVVEAPPERDREAAPDARVRTRFDSESTMLTFEHVDGETVPADELELWVNGELADSQPVDRLDAFAEGDELQVDTGPLATVGLRWFDESQNAYYAYASTTVDRDAFEIAHDLDAGTATITYTGEHDADPGKLQVRHRSRDGGRSDVGSFGNAGDTLETGESVVVEDVDIGDSIRVQLDVPDVEGIHSRPLARLRVSPPRLYIHDHRDRGIVVRYHDRQERDAEEFQVLVDGEPADVQLADEVDTLSPGDDVELGEFQLGTELTIEWVEPDESIVVAERVVTPETSVSMTYEDGTVEVEHTGGDAVDADSLEFRVNGSIADEQPADQLDEFAEGDAFSAAVPPLAAIELYWTGGERDHYIGSTTTAVDSFTATYDADAEIIELTYEGERAADPERLVIRNHGQGSRGSDPSTPFADAYDELNAGDSVEIDAGLDEYVVLALRMESEHGRSMRSVAHYSTTPRHGFRFLADDGALRAVYQDSVERDADEFRLLADGDLADRQPSDAHDTLTVGDEIVLDDVETGTTLTAEWTAPAEPREVGKHVVAPSASFDVTYDDDAETLEVSHAGGDALDADDLSVFAPPALSRPSDWKADGTVTEGDSATFEATAAPKQILVLFQRREILDREHLDDESFARHL